MNLKTKFFASLACVLFSYTATQAQSKVAHIDTQQLFAEMPEVIAAQKELEKLEKTYTTDIENSLKEFQAKAQSYAADVENQTEITNQARQKELESLQQNIQGFRETAAQDLQKKQVEMMRPLYDKARQAIEKVAAALGFDYVLDASQGGGVLVANGKNIMPEVKKELGF
ncbi:MAG: OmpH family outer membrane protein [Flavobacteriaceae bacterium]